MKTHTADTVLLTPPPRKAPVLMFMVTLAGVAALALWLARLPFFRQAGLGALPLSLLLGMALAGTARVEGWRRSPAVTYWQRQAQTRLLQTGIILLGLQLDLADLWAVGWQALAADVVVITVILPLGIWLGQRWLKLPLRLGILLAIGSAICGAAAILACVPVLNRYLDDDPQAADQQAVIAIALVAVLGTVSVLLYPWLQHWLHLSDAVTGLFIGSTVHEVAQALAAADTLSQATQQTALITKLLRVLLLAPVLVLLAVWLQRRQPLTTTAEATQRIRVPGFLWGFMLMVLLNSLVSNGPLVAGWQNLQAAAVQVSAVLLVLAMTAMGMNSRWLLIRQAGIRPFMLGLLLWCALVPVGGMLMMWLTS